MLGKTLICLLGTVLIFLKLVPARDLSLQLQGKCRRQVMKLRGQSGTLESPGYPNKYERRQVCIWHIQVQRGFQVRLLFDSVFDVKSSRNCNRDAVFLSSVKQRFRNHRASATGRHTVTFCSNRKPYNSTVLSPATDLWVKFKASRRGADGKGFRATYTAVDVDECNRTVNPSFHYGGCQQQCINTHGSYHCACRYGYKLLPDGKNCIESQEYRVWFFKKKYKATIPYNHPIGWPVLTTHAQSTRSDNRLAFSIVEVNNRPASSKQNPFKISRTGAITLNKRLPTNKKLYRLIIEARVNDLSRARVNVEIRVNGQPGAGPVLLFTNSNFILIPPDYAKTSRDRKLLQVRVKASDGSSLSSLSFRLKGRAGSFRVDPAQGTLSVVQDLSHIVSKVTRVFNVTVIVSARAGKRSLRATNTVHVVVVPAYSGNSFIESSIKTVNQSKASKPTGSDRDRGSPTKVEGYREFSLHRLFRRPSLQVRKISLSEFKFNRIISEIKRQVVFKALGNRSRTNPVTIRLGTKSVASSKKISEILKTLECAMPVANCSDREYHSKYRTMDGTCNNPNQPLWGAAPNAYRRLLDPIYYDSDSLSDPIGFPNQPFAPSLPSAHTVSKRFFIHIEKARSVHANDMKYSHMLMQWGQFLDHDVTFTAESEGSERCFLPRCDNSPEDFEPPCFPILYEDGPQCTMFTRSAAACQSGDGELMPRQQLNTITSFLDGSVVYGSSDDMGRHLRDLMTDKGYLRTSPGGLLPYVKSTLKPPLSICQVFGGCFDAGDFRANEQIALASMHTMWVREHNRIAHVLQHLNRHWDGDQIYQEARKIVGAQIQHITYTEYLPKVLGAGAMPPYDGYKDVDPTISNVFAAAAFRFGHSLVRPSFALLDANYDPVAPEVPLMNAFFNNKFVQKHGIENILLGLLANVSLSVDRVIAAGLTKHLFQQPESDHGFDLAALNIQRGRDHGLPGYGAWRRECNLPHAEIFEEARDQIKSRRLRRLLKAIYDDDVENADLWVVALAEDPVPGSLVGPTTHCLLKKQFQRLRDGDRFWYENPTTFTAEQLAEIRKTSLSRVMCENLNGENSNGIVSIQKDAFLAATDGVRRVECAGITKFNLRMWKEIAARPPKPTDSLLVNIDHRGSLWSEWIYSTRRPTGTWAVAVGRKVCDGTVVGIQCQTVNGLPWKSTGETVHCQALLGVYCRTREQKKPDARCSDYRFRFLCSSSPKRESNPNKPRQQHIFRSDGGLRCNNRRYPQDFPLSFPVEQTITIEGPLSNDPNSEYLRAGQFTNSEKKRFLMQFDVRRIPRRSIIHSAQLLLYLVDIEKNQGHSTSPTPPNALEVYRIISTGWSATNTTSLVPWHDNYLGLGSDVHHKRVSASDYLTTANSGKWIRVDVLSAVKIWQIYRTGTNYGFMFKLGKEASANGIFRFASDKHANQIFRPKLFVCLTIPPW